MKGRPIKFNAFQRLTRQWDAMHPYNGAQLMRLRGQPDVEHLCETLRSTLNELGIRPFEIRANRYRISADPVTICLEDMPLQSSLSQSVTRELNVPFDRNCSLPVRPLLIADGDGYHIGLVYHHWAADSFSIRLLMREWLLRLMNQPHRTAPLRIAREGFWKLFGPDRAGWQPVEALLTSAKWNARFKKVRRVDRKSSEDLSTHFSLHFADEGLINDLIAASRRMKVKVNDLFIAAMARVCDRVPMLRRMAWREDLALGTIVDLRPMAPAHWPQSFGLFLGFTSLFVRPIELRDPHQLLSAIRRQQNLQQQTAAAQASMLRMTAGLLLAKLLRPASLTEFYRKRLALSAGISNVNLNPHWPASFFPDTVQSYVRVSPVGPMMPIVFTPTTLGRTLNLGLTCRTSVVAVEDAPRLAREFFAELCALSEI